MSLSVEYNTLLDKADRVLRLIINGSINANDDIDVSIINKISKLPN